jgi:hypothetical protein
MDLYRARSIQPTKHVTRFNLNLPFVRLSPDVLILSVSQSKPAKISELHSMMGNIQHLVKHRTGSFYTGHPVVFKYACIKERSRIAVYTQLYHTCKNSYMFRLYKCSLHQAGYRTANKKIIKISSITFLLSCILIVFLFKVINSA